MCGHSSISSFHLQAHTQAHARKETQRKGLNPCDRNSVHFGPTKPSNLNTCRYKQIIPLALGDHTHSITCIDLCTALVLSLTKSDLPIPSCGLKRNQLRVSHRCTHTHTRTTHPCSNYEGKCTVSAAFKSFRRSMWKTRVFPFLANCTPLSLFFLTACISISTVHMISTLAHSHAHI